MKKKLLSMLLAAAMTVIMVVPVFASTGEYNQNNDNDANPPKVEVTFSKPVSYTVSLPLTITLSSKEIKAEDVIEAYDKEKTQQTPTLTDITEQTVGKKIWSDSFLIKVIGLIDATHVVKVTPSSFTMRATDSSDTASAITKANVTDLTKEYVKFKNPLNTGATDAYELPEDYDATQTATGFIWVDNDDIDSASVYKGTMNFTITLEPNS